MAKRTTQPQRLLVGNCLEKLKTLDDASIDSIVTDPPYELGFMGKTWDASGIAYNVELWRECLRVLKPGGHLLAFGGTRTYHRMAVAIEDAGFEIRDSIHWVYGSGFPKSLDVSKAIDKRGGATADFAAFRDAVKHAMKRNGVTRAELHVALGNHMLSHYLTAGSQPAVPNSRDYRVIRDAVGLGDAWDHLFPDEAEREVVGTTEATYGYQRDGERWDKDHFITVPATDAAKQWQGWGTALKPAHEPIVLARKPLVGTVAATVLAHGTGALNIDGCRIESEARPVMAKTAENKRQWMGGGPTTGATSTGEMHTAGRWPANIIFDEAAGAELDAQSGLSKSTVGKTRGGGRSGGILGKPVERADKDIPFGHNDEGGASRFFYCPKPGKKERNAGGTNTHPTVKPLALIRYLQRLVTPPGGTTLDPFMGSGTSAAAAILEGFEWRGCEMTKDYLPIIKARTAWATKERKAELAAGKRKAKAKQAKATS